ncbi:gag/pol protein [Cucumis melo var. makuwa]|uniref:Gag/pol protein n=1 Tax=Cucumis melo var. makuwa TaxID=1194695 RepID=A0A5A7TW30_CUCMM|nr:gag/pol protein [Cucumis melo var. makuwa]TYK14037.1 gag/pol protein [Cucumis melo var. makuwa]
MNFCSNGVILRSAWVRAAQCHWPNKPPISGLKGQKEGDENVAHSKRFQKGSSSRTKFTPSFSGSKKIQKKKEGKGNGPTAAAEGKGKTQVAIKGKCFHYNVDEHWKRNYPKYLANKKKKEVKYD